MVGDRGSNRRTFLAGAAGVAAAAWLGKPARASAWDDEVGRILARIKPPVFPKRDFDVARYGALGDGKTDCSEAISRAIAEMHSRRRRACDRSRGSVPDGPDPPQEQRQPARARGLDAQIQPRSEALPAGGIYPLGRSRVPELLPLIYADGEENLAVTAAALSTARPMRALVELEKPGRTAGAPPALPSR